jgi:hypothetical protein
MRSGANDRDLIIEQRCIHGYQSSTGRTFSFQAFLSLRVYVTKCSRLGPAARQKMSS